MVMRGSFLSWSESTCRVCGCAGLASMRKPWGKPPGGGFSVTLSASRWRTPRWAGALAGIRILLSVAEPKELSPGSSHSRAARASQPSGFWSSMACCSRQATISRCQSPFCDEAEQARKTQKRKRKRIESIRIVEFLSIFIGACFVSLLAQRKPLLQFLRLQSPDTPSQMRYAVMRRPFGAQGKQDRRSPKKSLGDFQQNNAVLRDFGGVGILHGA